MAENLRGDGKVKRDHLRQRQRDDSVHRATVLTKQPSGQDPFHTGHFCPAFSVRASATIGCMTTFPARQAETVPTPPDHSTKGAARPPEAGPAPREHPGWLVAASLATGVLAALLLAFAPFIPATETGVAGGILVGLGLGWVMLVVLSALFTSRPQKWVLVPALFMGLGGILLLAFGAPAQDVFTWAGPPALLALAVWMAFQARRQLRSRGGIVLLYLVIAMLVMSSVGAGFETLQQAASKAVSPPQGQLIDVGGHRLYLNCTGSGNPTVVIEPGAGMMSADLGWIAPAVARETRVCVYDRAGRGWSDPAGTIQDGAQTAADLRTLLERGNVPGPYVLAGHSFGGLYALAFAARYPEDVAGLVLVDSTAPASDPASGHGTSQGSEDTMKRASALASIAGRLGAGRLLGATPGHLKGTADEYIRAGSSAQQAAGLRNFSDKPLVVLTAGTGSQPGWAASQEALASLSTNSRHRIIDGATHTSLITDQQGAAATIRGILDVVAAVQTAGPLRP
jgi:pimeloyl-ACP methyl ester carboxylesterase